MTKIRAHRIDWFDRVALWRGKARSSTARQAVSQEPTRYYFRIGRFTHCIEARTLSQMSVDGRGESST